MRFLLDAHALLWLADNSPLLTRTAAAKLCDSGNDLFLSAATIWELAIKFGIKKLNLSGPFPQYIAAAISTYSLAVIPISAHDCVAYSALPFPDPNHRDPFDRMLVVHASANALSLVSGDTAFDSYGITRVW
jgi:PIN domain nuclease of toxin-antitoxin system